MRRMLVFIALGVALAGLAVLVLTAGVVEDTGWLLRGRVTRLFGTERATIAVVDPETTVTVIGPEGANITVGAIIEARGRPRVRGSVLEMFAPRVADAP